MTDAACDSVANLVRMSGRMRFLTLDDNYIGDRGVRTLCEPIKADYCGLSLMAFSRNKLVTDASVDELCAVMKEGRYLYQLYMVDCSLSATATETLRMAAAQRSSFILHV